MTACHRSSALGYSWQGALISLSLSLRIILIFSFFFLPALPPRDDNDVFSGALLRPLLLSPRLLFCLPSLRGLRQFFLLSSSPLALFLSLFLPHEYTFSDLQLVSGRCTSNGLINRKQYDLSEL